MAKHQFTLPTIFQFAKHAGYRTTLIDLQMSNGERQNWLAMKDLKYIDRYITADRDMDVALRDRDSISRIKQILGAPEKQFLVLVKWGAHWPYQDTYPKPETTFSPVVTSSLGSMGLENKQVVVNTYMNSVRFSADGFLKELLGQIPLEDRILIYTSDHGQAMFDNGDIRTHGGVAPANGVGSVPLLIFAKGAKEKFPVLQKNGYSSFQIFNTTLKLLGYGDELVAGYGPTLWEVPKPEYRSFLVTWSGAMQPYVFPQPGSSASAGASR
jgi:glucan phosphoethanolaminetransferase (alkaline phosphatase superfamily)